ncbi:MAG: ABC-F family ATP-binding cassette domain-containing protein [Geminicoccaceae bacterium]
MLNLNDVTVRVAGRPLLENATLRLPAGTRMGLVGRNGSGKSTLLRLIAGEMQPDQGTVRMQSGASFGMVAQEAPGGAATPLATVLAADRELTALQAELAHADPSRIAEIHDRMVALGAATATARAAGILKGLGFDEAMQAAPMDSFSGGWRMRVALASVLFVEPDLLLLDEPTNHLDLEATMWLEDYLRRYPRTLLVVSHDRDLLNAVPQKICHLEQRKLTVYNGAYDTFARTRAERIVLLEKQRARQDAERAHIQSFVDRFRYKASKARQAQSRIKLLEKMKEVAVLPPEPEVEFHFPVAELPAPPLVTMDGVRCGYGERVVLDRLNLRLDPDDRIALLGANGNGKSTFAKLVAGRLQPMAGECVRARGLRVGFFAQHQIEDLEPDQSGLEHLRARRPEARDQDLRARLARFGLDANRAETPAKHLSGGEKTRLAMVLMCLDEPQILILDEPTNHLDIDSREALVEALNDYPGAVLLISHDRHLVELVADRLWLVAAGRVAPYEGDLDDYRAMLLATSAEARPMPTAEGPRQAKMSAAERRAILAPLRQRAKEAEREVERLSRLRAAVEARLADPATYANGADIGALQKEAAGIGARIEAAEARWLEAEAEIEGVEAA